MCGTDCWTDHRLVVSKLNLRIQPARRPQGKESPKRLDVSKLNQYSKRQVFITDICNHLGAVQLILEDPEGNCTIFRNAVHSSAVDTLWHTSSKTKMRLARMVKKSRVFLKKNTLKMILAQYPRRQPTTTFVWQYGADTGTCMIHRSGRNPVLCGQEGHEEVPWCTKTVYGPKSSGPPHCSVQMEAHFWQIKMLSWKGEQNASIVCSIAHQLSMTMLSTDCHRWSAMFSLMNSQLSLKQPVAEKLIIAYLFTLHIRALVVVPCGGPKTSPRTFI